MVTAAETSGAEVLLITQKPIYGRVPFICHDSAVAVCSGPVEGDFGMELSWRRRDEIDSRNRRRVGIDNQRCSVPLGPFPVVVLHPEGDGMVTAAETSGAEVLLITQKPIYG